MRTRPGAMLTPDESAEYERALRWHGDRVYEDLTHPERERLELHLRIAGSLRVLLCDTQRKADNSLLLRYAAAKGAGLYVWTPYPPPEPTDHAGMVVRATERQGFGTTTEFVPRTYGPLPPGVTETPVEEIPPLNPTFDWRHFVAHWRPRRGDRQVRITDFLDLELGTVPVAGSGRFYTARELIRLIADKETFHFDLKRPEIRRSVKELMAETINGHRYDDYLARSVLFGLADWTLDATSFVLTCPSAVGGEVTPAW